MLKQNKKIFYVIGSFIVTLLIGITVFIIAIVSKDSFKKLKAESMDYYEITVEKTPTVTVYVSGVGVNKKSSNNSEEIYEVEKGTEISLRAINESKIFLNWEFNPNINSVDKTSSYIVFTPTSDLKIDIARRDPLKDDFGKYIQNSFVIDETRLLLNLRKVFDAGTTSNKITEEIIKYYDEFFAECEDYTLLNATSKVTAIQNTYFYKIQNGYFTVPTSFAIFEDNYYGIGTETNPFKGVFCGLNANQNTSIFLTTICNENAGINYSGLFGVTEQEAVIRNLKLSINIAFSKDNKATDIYVGGIAGKINGSYLTNLNISSRFSVSETENANIYVGGIAGLMENGNKEKVTGLNENNNIVCNLDDCEWLLGYQSSGRKMMAGILSGLARNVYVKNFQASVSNFAIKTKFSAVNSFNNNTLSYIGNLCGYYENDSETIVENINIIGTSSENLIGVSSSGNVYVGGLIGYSSSKKTFTIGKISYKVQGVESKIISQAQSAESQVNLYTGGLIAKVDDSNGNTTISNSEFKNGIKNVVVDGVTKHIYEPIFEGNVTITSIQKGQSDGKSFGKSVAGGLIGYGYIDMNGDSETDCSQIVLSKDDSKFTVNAIQSSTSTGTQNDNNTIGLLNNDKEHCISGLVYGLQTIKNNSGIKISNIYFYATNVEVESIREVGSTAGGDLHTGGFAGYSYCIDYENISLLINNASVNSYGYSYDGTWGVSGPWGEKIQKKLKDSNNVYTGGFVGEFSGSKTKTANIKNVKITGFDYYNGLITGASLNINSLQNTPAPKMDYSAENYVGGIIGRLYYANVDNCVYEGLNTDDNNIRLLADKSPDTSFCGGIVGFIKNNNDDTAITTNIKNCLIKNANISSNTTVLLEYGNPDMYTGGIIGASFNGGSTSSILNIDNCRVYNCNITSIGNEKIVVYGAGIIGINTWQGITTISNCCVCDCNIEANEYNQSTDIKSDMNSYAAGIIAEFLGSSCEVNNCAVIDTLIKSSTEMSNSSSTVAGILARGRNDGSYTISNCYSNARLFADSKNGDKLIYGIANKNSSKVDRNSYYILNNASGAVNDSTYLRSSYNFKGLSVSTITIDDNDEHDIFVAMGNNTSSSANIDKYRNKFYPIFMDDRFNVLHTDQDNKIITISKKLENRTGVLRVWINSRKGGSTKNPNDYNSDFERNEAGWFLLTEIFVKTGKSENEGNIEEVDIFYPVGENEEYIYNADNVQFENTKYPYNVTDYIGYEENRNRTNVLIGDINNVTPVTVLTTLTVKIFDKMPSVRIEFTVYNDSKDVSLYYPTFFDNNGKKIDVFANKNYGTYIYNKVDEEEINGFRKVKYIVEFTPNYDLVDDADFYLGFKVGTTDDVYANEVFKISLVANKIKLVDFQYADYTIPSNYASVVDLGKENNPWLLRTNKAIKIIPIFEKKNDRTVDGKKPQYISEDNIQYVNFVLNDSYAATVSSNGELKTNTNKSNSNVYHVTLTLKNDPDAEGLNVYFKVVDVYSVTYSGIGSDLNGLLWTNTYNDYYLGCPINYGFGGNPKKFNVIINNGTSKKVYNKEELVTNGWIKNENNEVIKEWDINNTGYSLLIPYSYITGDINIEVEFEIVYAIVFDSQSQIFNPSTKDDHTKKYLVANQTLFSDYFKDELIEKELYPWVKEKGVFGYVFRGFYLIDNANSMVSYGNTFNEIVNKTNLKINTSYTFYARWSFLIEIIEAPGTHIKTSFADDFLDDYGLDSDGNQLPIEELEKLELNRAITIPINNNRGYAFTIEKDKDFIGKASVQAFICSKDNNDKVLTEIKIEKYHENMYIYYIPPEFITGYLVICTSVSSSELIVGENTATVTDTILPEDGVYTFKYVVNHFNKTNQISYIYNSGIEGDQYYNLRLKKDLLLQFYKEVYDVKNHSTILVPRELPENTIIEVYYNRYINGELVLEKSTVGTYQVQKGDNITQLLLSDFKKLNKDEPAFESATFAEELGENESFSETYYFVITPPNGHSLTNEINNNVIYVGYYDENKANTDNPFVSGRRSDYDLANKPLTGELNSLMTVETSKQIRVYTTTPSRVTQLDRNELNNEYIFKDIKNYQIFNLDIINGSISEEGYITLTDKSIKTDTIIESQKLDFGIIQLKLILGYGLGDVNIYGKTDDGDWELVKMITLTNYEYSEFVIGFDSQKNYSYFRIDNNSNNEIRMKGLSLSTLTNGMTYDFTSDDIKNAVKTVDTNKITLSMEKVIVGDTRHDGKQFVLAVQIDDKNNKIIENIPSDAITININGKIYNSYKNEVIGKNVSYFNLTSILNDLDLQEITIEIIINGEYSIKTVQLLEAISIQKPAMAEVRESYNN